MDWGCWEVGAGVQGCLPAPPRSSRVPRSVAAAAVAPWGHPCPRHPARAAGRRPCPHGHRQPPSPCQGSPIPPRGSRLPLPLLGGGLVPCPGTGRRAQSLGRVAQEDNAARVVPAVPRCPARWHPSPQSFLPSPLRPALFLAPGFFLPLGVFPGQGEGAAAPRGAGQGCWSRLGRGGWISHGKLSRRRLGKAAEKEGRVGTARGPGGCP